jgi:hypothetical protein
MISMGEQNHASATRGSALYSVRFALSRPPPGGWTDLFLQSWDYPQTFTTRHRPGIASVRDATITLTIEEVEEVHATPFSRQSRKRTDGTESGKREKIGACKPSPSVKSSTAFASRAPLVV